MTFNFLIFLKSFVIFKLRHAEFISASVHSIQKIPSQAENDVLFRHAELVSASVRSILKDSQSS
ncbi:MAG: hypothetical protein COC22_02760 [Flavobacteriaceae bacterium]|nr:MAG: hypothetical protein COC22_02760 [Flavobacteriaceae bacterium]